MNKKNIHTVIKNTYTLIWIGFVLLIAIPIIVLTIMGFIIPFYKILCTYIAIVPCALPCIFEAWVVNRDWSFLSAIGTICAVIVAIFKDSILKYINRPKLDVVIEKKRPYIFNIPQSEIIVSREVPIGNTVYLSFQVVNNGNSLAKNVAVKAKRIRSENLNETLDMFLTPENIGIKSEKLPRDIPSKTGVYWNCIEIADPRFRKFDRKYQVIKNLTENKPALLIPLTYRLSTGHHIVDGGKYDIDILIVADEIQAIEKTIEVDTSQLIQWPVINDAKDDDEKRKREEDEILEKITFEVKDKNSLTDININNCHRVKMRFYAFKSCIKERLVEIEKRRMSNLSHSRSLQKK